MKKFLAPVILLVAVVGLLAYLMLDFSGVKSSFDADAYLQARSRIDSLEVALFEAHGNPDLQLSLRGELEKSWETLAELRTEAPSAADPTTETIGGFSKETVIWIAGGVAAVILCVVLLFALSYRRKVLTQRMEALKADQRFKEPKTGFENDATIAPRPRPQKRSIIEEVSEFAASQQADAPASAPKVAFEDENGVPENKILSTDLDAPQRPPLRPTAKERITSAMQSLSDVLRSPRGVARERTMKIRAQSHNMTGDPNLQASSPLKTNRFDREFTEKAKIMQMHRRGYPASTIASQLKVPQDQVESIIREALESGS
ncbi:MULTISPECIES: hypothetical protein [unclassified Fibrobacter]|jgi:hypothetical protein|uniref:hypothetical protein n=1 Tax=unclassified Fibrobacter TaxID=2634177 RepID=UPI0015649475|nr:MULTISPECIES: hypothetical protein [unclassified Fibrobacter]